jgi:prepilin-type N-terminal cleavage/methylation domain-containing protein
MTSHKHDGFTLIELLIVITVLSILAALAVPAYSRYRMNANETSAIASMKVVAQSEVAYASACGRGGYATSMADLAKAPAAGGTGFITMELAEAVSPDTAKDGYVFVVADKPGSIKVADKAQTCNNSVGDPKSAYFATGEPAAPGTTGTRFFAVDEANLTRQSTGPLNDVASGDRIQ